MTQQGEQQKARPGTNMIKGGIVVLVLGVILLVFNLANPVSNYVSGVGMVETRGPSAGAIILLVGGLIIAGIGYLRRLLAAVERR
jgi:hypothetical protein